LSRKRNYEWPTDTWDKMKTITKKRFMLEHNYLDLYQKLQSLTQVSKSIEDYHKNMEVTMIL
jgi:hypothetical protein